MVQRLFAASLVFILTAACLGQQRGGVDPQVTVPLIMSVLSKANVSGSLEYWGRCDDRSKFPDFPRLHTPRSDVGTPLQTLSEMFADDPYMQVTQEPEGTIRMVESDVPSDLLDLTISHISFDGGTKKTGDKIETLLVDDPDDALFFIFFAPEVKAFLKSRDIGTPYDSYPMDRLTGPNGPHISGDLDNVTFSQALDHLLKTFPGLWTYENCPSTKRKRAVYFKFYSNSVGWAPLVKRQ